MEFLRPIAFIAALVWFAQAAPVQKTLQGNDCTAAGEYTLCQNLWGADTGVGSQTTSLISTNGNSVSFSTKYQWANSPNNVKSYPNVYHNTAKGMQLQDITSAPSKWQWYYQSASDDLRADVSYDIWTGVPKSGDPASAASSYEIMIWLSNRGSVGGIGNVVADNLELGGHKWTLKHGPNANWDVFSFITAEGDITDFDADLNDFFQYLVNKQGVAKTQYLQAVQVGTEPFTGNAELVISNFSVDVSTGDDQPSGSPAPSATTSKPAPSATKTTSGSSSHAHSSGTASGAPASESSVGSGGQLGARPTGSGRCHLKSRSSPLQRRD
ncbi:concanavalin A-like lectin/glucanase domain-containing protein [Trametes elegans]|nr:concanavalin A-like lectin/glucanase domain-containing protein [Trametes elegans]